MSHPRRTTAVVFDLEFTSWAGSIERQWSLPGEKKEVVQIGAVKLDAQDLKFLDSFETLVRPRWNPVLSEYFTALTGITNGALSARAIDFVTAYRNFLEFAGDASLWAFGRDDIVIADNLKLYGWAQDFAPPKYHNIIPWFAEQGTDLTGKHACDVAGAFGVPFDGHRHNALAAARGVAAGMAKCIEGGAPNPFLASGLMASKRRAKLRRKPGEGKK